MRRSASLDQFKNVLPYASEIFGVYRPMIGWKSKRILKRFQSGFRNDLDNLKAQALRNVAPSAALSALRPAAGATDRNGVLKIDRIDVGAPARSPPAAGSFLLQDIAARLPAEESVRDQDWDGLITREALNDALNRRVSPAITKVYTNPEFRAARPEDANDVLRRQVAEESRTARLLLDLRESGDFETLRKLFFGKATMAAVLARITKYRDPFDYIDPQRDLDRISLSPIGIVHLFRQYFFEFDTFLGTPVEHVWLSPGAQVELIETSTRRTYTERIFESESSINLKTETERSQTDELSDAVKQENRSDTKFGVNAKVEQSWVSGSAEATTSVNLDKTQTQAREETHKRMRQQSEKLSSEIRKNYKATFKTVTEVTDTSSKRYLLQNTTDKLVNYELRRKMRQVGVQVQDIGTYLCWQTYVDDPGRQLGVAELVHLAKSPELGDIPPPESVSNPQNTVGETPISIPFEPATGDTTADDMDETYKNGKETDTDLSEGDVERIRYTFGPFTNSCPQSGFEFDNIEFDYQNNDIRCAAYDVEKPGAGKITFRVEVRHVNFRNVSPLQIVARVHWKPTQATLDAIAAQNATNVEKYNAESQLAFKRAYVEAARERINIAADVKKRPYDDLREEERIIVYRALIQDMLTRDLPLTDPRTRHAVSELLNSIFDIDKMLYFVAPEWWRPRLHRSGQQLGSADNAVRDRSVGRGSATATSTLFGFARGQGGRSLAESATEIDSENIVTWGGSGRFDDYYITDTSQPAPLGSSLGWLLQLDGDTMRNAFLNAPWVKAVIPIRPGREKAACNWLRQLEVEGTEGLDALYSAPADELATIKHTGNAPTLRDAINHLCEQIAAKHEASNRTARFPADEINDDNRVSATPVDKVYEHGFYPIQGGFRVDVAEPFEVFDQWVEILPTDQIAPVEVTYDPITGRQIA